MSERISDPLRIGVVGAAWINAISRIDECRVIALAALPSDPRRHDVAEKHGIGTIYDCHTDLLNAHDRQAGVCQDHGNQGSMVLQSGLSGEIERLAALHAVGTISDAEFAQAKQRILSR